jgi:protein involved in sex pheromone biosynthesis
MKKVLALLAMAVMIVGLSGCMDDPDGSKQKVSSSVEL